MHGLTFYSIRMLISRFVMGTASLFVGSMAFFVGHLLDHRMTLRFSHRFTNFIVFRSIGYLDFRATFLSGCNDARDFIEKLNQSRHFTRDTCRQKNHSLQHTAQVNENCVDVSLLYSSNQITTNLAIVNQNLIGLISLTKSPNFEVL